MVFSKYRSVRRRRLLFLVAAFPRFPSLPACRFALVTAKKALRSSDGGESSPAERANFLSIAVCPCPVNQWIASCAQFPKLFDGVENTSEVAQRASRRLQGKRQSHFIKGCEKTAA